MSVNPRLAAAVLPMTLAFLVGCTEKNASVGSKVSGKVTYKGSTLTGGDIVFVSASGAGSYTGAIGADGRYTVVDMPDGEMKVVISTERLNPAKKEKPNYPGAGGDRKMGESPVPEGSRSNAASGGTYVQIPSKYGDVNQTDLKATLKKGSNSGVDFDLKD
jgi:hypothetical protein